VTVPDRVPLPRIYLAHRAPSSAPTPSTRWTSPPTLLGTGRASRLYASLVREQRLAQDATAFVFPIVGGASMFTFWVTARPGIEPERLEAALHAELDRLASEGPTHDELERVRNLHAARTAASLERIAERADRLSMYTCLFDEPERVNEETERYGAVTRTAWPTACATRSGPTTG
jgi:zinc protease